MAGDKKKSIIIKKVVGGGGHGHHGGAWKVAYADFVTAMMAFFLVMWLMGSDEEIKASVAHYFNHPNTPYKDGRDPASKVSVPLGEKEGEGESLLAGLGGLMPEDPTVQPLRPVKQEQKLELNEEMKNEIHDKLGKESFAFDVSVDYVRFSVPEAAFFEPGSTDLHANASKTIDKISQVIRRYPGYLQIAGHQAKSGNKYDYEFTMARASSLVNHLIENRHVSEDRIVPVGAGSRYPYAPEGTVDGAHLNNRIEFILSFQMPKL
jgi:chemotaxis protein MotB